MKRLSLLLLLLFCSWAYGQTSTLVINKTAEPTIQDLGDEPSDKGVYVVPPARFIGGVRDYDTVTQKVIKAFANHSAPGQSPGSFPAGAILGYGPISVIQADANTQNLPAASRALLITEFYGNSPGPGFQQRTEPGYDPAVLKPIIRDVTVVGHDINADDYATEGVVDKQPYVKNLASGAITGATNASPIVITTSVQAPNTGQQVTIAGVGGNTAANGTDWTVTRLSSSTFSLNGSTGNGAYTSGGTWTCEDLYDLIRVRGSGPEIRNVQAAYCPGTALTVVSAGGVTNGQTGIWDSEKTRIFDFTAKRVYRGIYVGLIDCVLGRIEIEGFRDYGIQIASDVFGSEGDAGGIQFDGYVHIYGGAGAPCLWVTSEAGEVWGNGPMYLENAGYGALIENNGTRLSTLFSKENTIACVYMTSTSENTYLGNIDFKVRPGTKGIMWESWHSQVKGGRIRLDDDTAIGTDIMPLAGEMRGVHIDGVTYQGFSDDGGVGLLVRNNLNQAYINIQGRDIGTVADFDDAGVNRIGSGNTIIVKFDPDLVNVTHNGVEGVDLPDSWTTTPTATTNYVEINGTRYYPP